MAYEYLQSYQRAARAERFLGSYTYAAILWRGTGTFLCIRRSTLTLLTGFHNISPHHESAMQTE